MPPKRDIDSFLVWGFFFRLQPKIGRSVGNGSQPVEDFRLPAEPLFWTAWYYVGCLAACAGWQRELSHLLHSIFISLPSSGGKAQRDFGWPRRAPLAQQVTDGPRSQRPPKPHLIRDLTHVTERNPDTLAASLRRAGDEDGGVMQKRVIRCL